MPSHTLDKSSIPKTAFNSPFSKYEYVKVPFGLAQTPPYFQELITGILKDFKFAIPYLDEIIIFSRTAEGHLYHIKQIMSCKTLQEVKQMSLLFQRDSIFRTHSKHKGHLTITFKDASHPEHASTKAPKQVHAFLGLVGYYRKFIKKFVKMAKPLTQLTCQQVTFDWTPAHHKACLHLKESIVQAPILCYLDPNKRYIVYTDASDDGHGLQLSKEHDCTEFPIAFLSHTFWKHKGNGAQPNRKLMEFIMPL